jgi:hypothetical protein
MIRFTLKARLDALSSPQKINYWNKGTTKSRCPFCALLWASTRHIQKMCHKRGTNSLVPTNTIELDAFVAMLRDADITTRR